MYKPSLERSQVQAEPFPAPLLSQLEDLHPLDFRLAFGLTHEEAADELCLEPQTMRSYTKKNPSKRVRKLAAIMAKKLIINGHQLLAPELLLKAISNFEPIISQNDWRKKL